MTDRPHYSEAGGCIPCKQKSFNWKDQKVIYAGDKYIVHSFDSFNSVLFLRDENGNKVNIRPSQVEGTWTEEVIVSQEIQDLDPITGKNDE